MIKSTSTAFEAVGLFESVIDKKVKTVWYFCCHFCSRNSPLDSTPVWAKIAKHLTVFILWRSTYTYLLFQIAQLSPIASPYVMYKLYITELWYLWPNVRSIFQWPLFMSLRASQVMRGSHQFCCNSFCEIFLLERYNTSYVFSSTIQIDWNAVWPLPVKSTWGQIFKMTFQSLMMVHSTRLDDKNTMLAAK